MIFFCCFFWYFTSRSTESMSLSIDFLLAMSSLSGKIRHVKNQKPDEYRIGRTLAVAKQFYLQRIQVSAAVNKWSEWCYQLNINLQCSQRGKPEDRFCAFLFLFALFPQERWGRWYLIHDLVVSAPRVPLHPPDTRNYPLITGAGIVAQLSYLCYPPYRRGSHNTQHPIHEYACISAQLAAANSRVSYHYLVEKEKTHAHDYKIQSSFISDQIRRTLFSYFMSSFTVYGQSFSPPPPPSRRAPSSTVYTVVLPYPHPFPRTLILRIFCLCLFIWSQRNTS